MKKNDLKTVTVSRVDFEGPADVPKKEEPVTAGKRVHKKPKFGILKGGKTARNKPRFEGVKDPAKAPPSKKSKTLRILTDKGLTLRRKRIAEEVSKTPISKIRQTLRAKGMPIKESTPDKLVRKIYEDAQEAGMISSA